jgi:hypothetical protein
LCIGGERDRGQNHDGSEFSHGSCLVHQSKFTKRVSAKFSSCRVSSKFFLQKTGETLILRG